VYTHRELIREWLWETYGGSLLRTPQAQGHSETDTATSHQSRKASAEQSDQTTQSRPGVWSPSLEVRRHGAHYHNRTGARAHRPAHPHRSQTDEATHSRSSSLEVRRHELSQHRLRTPLADASSKQIDKKNAHGSTRTTIASAHSVFTVVPTHKLCRQADLDPGCKPQHLRSLASPEAGYTRLSWFASILGVGTRVTKLSSNRFAGV